VLSSCAVRSAAQRVTIGSICRSNAGRGTQSKVMSMKSSLTCTTPCSSGRSVAQPRLAMPMLRARAAGGQLARSAREPDERALVAGEVDVADQVARARVQHLHRGVQVVAHPPQVQHLRRRVSIVSLRAAAVPVAHPALTRWLAFSRLICLKKGESGSG
jgi:hypothetical protein